MKVFNHLNKALFVLVFLLLAVVMLFKFLSLELSVNKSESLHYSIFLVNKSKNLNIQKNDLVQIEFKNRTKKRFFADGTLMIKEIKGVPSDEVFFLKEFFFINGEYLGKVKSFALSGDDLYTNQNTVLQSDEYFLFTSHIDSYDSRYLDFGYINKEQIVGKVIFKI